MNILSIERHITNERTNAYAALLAFALWPAWLYVLWSGVHDNNGVSSQGLPIGLDFLAFWSAARLLVLDRFADVYDLETLKLLQQTYFTNLTGDLPWLYPPHALLFVAPLGHLSYLTALCVYVTVSWIVFATVAWQFDKLRDSLWPVLASPLLLMTFLTGQNILFTSAVFGAALLALPKRPVLSGVLFGVLSIKPQLGLLIPAVLLVTRQWQCFFSASATTLILLGSSIIFFGPNVVSGFIAAMSMMTDWMASGIAPLKSMPTLTAFLLHHELPYEVATLIHASVAAAVLGTVLWIWLRPIAYELKCAALVIGSLLATPYFLRYDLALLVLAIAFFVSACRSSGWLPGERLFLVSAWLLPFIFLLISSCSLTPAVPFFLVVFLALIIRRARATLSSTSDSSMLGRTGDLNRVPAHRVSTFSNAI